MTDFKNEYIRNKTLEQLIDDLGKPVALPTSVVHEMQKAAIQAKMVERLAAPRMWALVSLAAAVVSALAAVAAIIVGA